MCVPNESFFLSLSLNRSIIFLVCARNYYIYLLNVRFVCVRRLSRLTWSFPTPSHACARVCVCVCVLHRHNFNSINIQKGSIFLRVSVLFLRNVCMRSVCLFESHLFFLISFHNRAGVVLLACCLGRPATRVCVCVLPTHSFFSIKTYVYACTDYSLRRRFAANCASASVYFLLSLFSFIIAVSTTKQQREGRGVVRLIANAVMSVSAVYAWFFFSASVHPAHLSLVSELGFSFIWFLLFRL